MNQSCSPARGIKIGYSVKSYPSGIIYSFNGYKIFPTTVKGIGISFNDAHNSPNPAYPAWPNALWPHAASGSFQGDTWIDIRVWKTPEFTPAGNIDFTGPVFMQILSPTASEDTISSCPDNTSEGKIDNRTCVWLSREIKGSVNFQSGTCELTNTTRTVYMGSYHSSIGKSPWKDARFTLTCPAAYGYNSTVSNADNPFDANDGSRSAQNATRNKPVRIQIYPYGNVINATQGIFALTPGGAEGYGIQLAWGAPGEQTHADNPISPVVFGFNGRVLASSKNSNFNDGSGGNIGLGARALPVGADGTINMSARYIRTTGPIKPGPADGKVEIIAAYE